MPYKMFRKGGKYCVKNSETGDNKGCSDSREMAIKHMRRLYQVEGEGKKEALTDEMIDALVNEAIIQFELEYPDEPQETKEAHYSDAGWLRPGITTFADLESAMEEEEKVSEMRDLISAYPTLASNILWSPEIEDKPTALKNLADELGQRLAGVSSEEKEMKPKFIERIVSAVKERLHLKEEPMPEDGMMIWKEGSQYRWIARYSNNFRDQDNPPEIISAQSHRDFVEMVDKGLASPPQLWLWHVPEWKIGQATWVGYDESGFAMSGGYFDKGCEQVAEWLLSKEDVAVSHGMPPKSIVRDQDDPSVIVQHRTAEISPLPSWAAANMLTDFATLTKEAEMAIPQKKREYLLKNWGMPEEVLKSLEDSNEIIASGAKEVGLESKESGDATEQAAETPTEATEAAGTPVAEEVKEETPAPEVKEEETEEDPQNGHPTRKEVAEATVAVILPMFEKQEAALTALKEALDAQIAAMNERMDALQKSDKEKVSAFVAGTPLSSLTAIMGSVIGNPATEIKGKDKLAESKPKETETPPDNDAQPTPVPFINAFVTSAKK